MGRPRHATIVAYLALFLALGGTTYAAAKFTSEDIKDESLTTVDIKDSSLLAQDFNEADRESLRGERGEQGPEGPEGPEGPQGPEGTLKGYAHVLADGTLVADRSKGVVGVERVGVANYCFDLDFAPKVGNVTTQSRSGAVVGQVVVGDAAIAADMGCDPEHGDAAANTFFSHTGLDTAAPFYVLFE
jgi:hypothetical protein